MSKLRVVKSIRELADVLSTMVWFLAAVLGDLFSYPAIASQGPHVIFDFFVTTKFYNLKTMSRIKMILST